MHILDLSDEVLVLIFEYMTGQDKVNLFETCNRFNQLLKDRKLVGKLSFHGCFTTSMIDINVYLKPKICRENVTELNLTSCYWLRSMDIRTCVVKLTNLEALYAADTSLSLQHVLQILRTLPQLKKLSWSWGNMDVEQVATWNNMDNLFKQIDAVSSKLTSLEFLFLYLKTEYFAQEDMYILNRWLMHCSGLQELWVLVPFFLSGIYIPEYVGSCHFPNLHTVVTNLPDNPLSLSFIQSLSNMIFNGCSSETSWRYLWIPFFESGYLPDVSKIRGLVTCRHTYVALNTCRDIEQLAVQNEAIQIQSLNLEGQNMKKLLCGKNVSSITWDSLWTSFTSLEELNIRVCVENIINVYNQSNLSKLALPTCILQGTGITSTSRATASYSVMKVLVETCPNIKEFEFTPCITCVYSPAFKDQELSLILLQNWKQLRRIKLSGLPCVLSGKSFQQEMWTQISSLEDKQRSHIYDHDQE